MEMKGQSKKMTGAPLILAYLEHWLGVFPG